MIGFVKKDILLFLRNSKSLPIILFIYFVFLISSGTSSGFILPMMTIVMSMSSFSYDDFNGFNVYAAALPNGRKNLVAGKYLSSYIMAISGALISLLVTTIYAFVTKSSSFDEVLGAMVGMMTVILLIPALIYPMMFKFGSEKGRISMFLITALIWLGGMMVLQIPGLSTPNAQILQFLEQYGLLLIILVIIVLNIGSWLLSLRIIRTKEF